jgi:hypothetical protein
VLRTRWQGKGTAMENLLMLEYAVITMPGIDDDDVRLGQMLALIAGLSLVLLGRLAYLVS